VPVVLLGLRPLVNAEGSARLLGMNLAFLLVAGQGFFENEGNWRQRAARIVLALLIFLAITLASRHLLALLFAEAAEAVQIAVHIAGSFLFLWGATYASLKLGLFQQSNSRE